LNKAGVPVSQQYDITDNDLEVVQQLAIWYFTNYDEQTGNINPTVSQSRMDISQILSINGEKIDDIEEARDSNRASNLEKIYQYFINGAIENASSYIKDEETGEITKEVE